MARDCDDTPCTGTVGPGTPSDNTNNGGQCVPSVSGTYCPPKPMDPSCRPWQLSNNKDSCFIDGVVNEALSLAGAPLNVYKLLGVHEQAKLVDATGMGKPISNGDLPGFPASNAFDVFQTQWRSIQKGTAVLPSAFIGYDFGQIRRLDGSLRMYGIDASIRMHIASFAIKQSAYSKNRASKVRLERSEDGIKWFGVSIVSLPDNDCLNTVLTRGSVPSRYWRLRPTEFNGGPTDYWGVQALQMFHNYEATHINNIQDKVFLENRDRSYSTTSIPMKGYYDLVDIQSELSKFGIELPSQTLSMRVNFSQTVASLGRPFVVGDIIEIPSEAQYSATMQRVLKWMEVTDVSWSSEGYTPGWQPTLMTITLQPAMVTQETQDLFGDLKDNPVPNGLGLVDRNDGNDSLFQDYFDAGQTAEAEAKDNVPEKGAEGSSTIRTWDSFSLKAVGGKVQTKTFLFEGNVVNQFITSFFEYSGDSVSGTDATYHIQSKTYNASSNKTTVVVKEDIKWRAHPPGIPGSVIGVGYGQPAFDGIAQMSEVAAAALQGLTTLQKTGLNPTGLYVEDAMPPNNAPFTEGTTYPINPSNGDYHRLTYEGASKDVPARLYRYSQAKGRWIFLEMDRRAQFNPDKPILQEFLVSPTRKPHTNVTK